MAHNLAKEVKKQTKRQETRQYPPRFVSSKPSRPRDITSTFRTKLNLKHLRQTKQPESVKPSENTRKRNLSG